MATDVIKEFAADNVKYLELRSTPRAEKDTGRNLKMDPEGLTRCFVVLNLTSVNSWVLFFILGLTKKNYVEAVIKAIQQCKDEGVDIDVRLMIMAFILCLPPVVL